MTNEERVEAQYVKKLSADLQLSESILENFSDRRKGGPVAYILAQAAKEAAEATIQLTKVTPTEVEEIRRLQGVVSRQMDIVHWLSTALIAGQQAFSLLDMRERGELLDEISDSFTDGE